jgi:hypothetical protein
MAAFFPNAMNFWGDRELVVQHYEGNQYNHYDARGRRRSSNAANIRPRGGRRTHRQNHNNANNNPPHAGPDQLDLRGRTFNIIQGRIVNRAPPDESQPTQPTPNDDGGEDVEMNDTVAPLELEPKATTPAAIEQPLSLALTYVVLQLDIDITVQSLQQYPTLAAAVHNMQTTKFVGYVEPIGNDTTFRIHLLRQGLPQNPPTECRTPQMYVPVLPNSIVDPESSRKPLRPNRDLPWENCYQSSFDHLVVRVLPQPGDRDLQTAITSLPAADFSRHSKYICEDYKYRNRIARQRRKERHIAEEELRNLCNNSNATLDDATLEQAQLNVAHATKASMTLGTSLSWQTDDQQDPIMTVRVSHDLSLVKDLPDPQELLNRQLYLVDSLKRLSKQSEELK